MAARGDGYLLLMRSLLMTVNFAENIRNIGQIYQERSEQQHCRSEQEGMPKNKACIKCQEHSRAGGLSARSQDRRSGGGAGKVGRRFCCSMKTDLQSTPEIWRRLQTRV